MYSAIFSCFAWRCWPHWAGGMAGYDGSLYAGGIRCTCMPPTERQTWSINAGSDCADARIGRAGAWAGPRIVCRNVEDWTKAGQSYDGSRAENT